MLLLEAYGIVKSEKQSTQYEVATTSCLPNDNTTFLFEWMAVDLMDHLQFQMGFGAGQHLDHTGAWGSSSMSWHL